jgi:cell division GTPase FtsZ
MCRAGRWSLVEPAFVDKWYFAAENYTNSEQATGGAFNLHVACPCWLQVVGVGGCASAAVQRLWDVPDATSLGLDVKVVNTDVQELAYAMLPDSSKLLLGVKAADWSSTRGDADIGKV